MEGLTQLRRDQRRRGPGLYAGTAPGGLVLTAPQQTMLILGPPRSGKTTSLIVPNVLAAPGAVIATSTKPELMEITAGARAATGGRCWLFDPSGTTPAPPGVTRIRWSPVAASGTWDRALLVARSLVGASRPGPRTGESSHWLERAEALLAPLLHAASVSGASMADVQRWTLRHDLDTPTTVVIGRGIRPAADVLAGLGATHERELSAIWSTAAGVLAAYRSVAAQENAEAVNFDPATLVTSNDSVYLCAPGREQDLLAPITVAFIESACSGAYEATRAGPVTAPLTLVLDEVANIAPLPSLPALVSEGAGQGVATIACLQDLAQARQRWGPVAEGFASLFGTKIALGGIGDLTTLELLSRLGGDVDVPHRSVSRGAWWSRQRAPQTTWSTRRQRRIPVDAVHHQPPGTALMIAGAQPPVRVGLRPWWEVAPFAEAQGIGAGVRREETGPAPGREAPGRGAATQAREAAAPVQEATAPVREAAPRVRAARAPAPEAAAPEQEAAAPAQRPRSAVTHEPEAPGHGAAPW